MEGTGDTGHIVVVRLMAGRATHGWDAFVLVSTLHIEEMDVSVVALGRSIVTRMAVDTARALKDRGDPVIGLKTRLLGRNARTCFLRCAGGSDHHGRAADCDEHERSHRPSLARYSLRASFGESYACMNPQRAADEGELIE